MNQSYRFGAPSIAAAWEGVLVRDLLSQEVEDGSATLLVVDDEPALRRLLSRVFEREGYRVLEAPSGEAAELVWNDCAGGVSVLVTDIVMPGGMDGLELAHRLRLERPDLPVLFTSGYCEGLMGARLAAHSQDRLLAKPFHPREALRKVRGLLRRQGAHCVAG
ncbi:MAG: response regulator [Candidatus Eisenbacteria bacterium]